MIKRILENVAYILGQVASSYWASKLNRLNCPIPGRTWDLPYKTSSMKEQKRWMLPLGNLLPRAKSWTTYAQFFLLNCQSDEVIPPDLRRIEWGDADKLKYSNSHTSTPPLMDRNIRNGKKALAGWNPGYGWHFARKNFLFPQVQRLADAWGNKRLCGEGFISHSVTHYALHRKCW